MSRKDYVAVAGLIRSRLPYGGTTTHKCHYAAVADFAGGMADLFASDNPRFDRGRFLAACGLAS